MATRAKRVPRASKGSQAGLGSSSKAGDKRRRAPSLRAKSLPSIAHMTAAGAIAEADSDGDELEEERSSDLDNATPEAVLFASWRFSRNAAGSTFRQTRAAYSLCCSPAARFICI